MDLGCILDMGGVLRVRTIHASTLTIKPGTSCQRVSCSLLGSPLPTLLCCTKARHRLWTHRHHLPNWKGGSHKVWRWHCSHLCHKPRCTMHLVWEPDWMNRSRDYCLGSVLCECCQNWTNACKHEPRCLSPHRATFARAIKKQKREESQGGREPALHNELYLGRQKCIKKKTNTLVLFFASFFASKEGKATPSNCGNPLKALSTKRWRKLTTWPS